MSELEEKKKRKKERRLDRSLPKNLPYVIGSREKEPKERRVAGLIVMHQMVRVVTSPVVVLLVKKEKNILHVDQLHLHVKKEGEVNLGAKKDQRGKMNQWKLQRKK